MAFEASSYQADQVIITFGPAIITRAAFADGTFASIEQVTDDIDWVAGTGGHVVFSRTNDRRAIFTFTTLQTALVNGILSQLSNFARDAPGMTGGIQPVGLADANGTALYGADNAVIMRPPDVTFDRTAQPRAWMIGAAELIRNDGGNLTL